MLSALFQNWDQVTKAQEVAASSMGTTNKKYEIYLQSIEAASNRMKTAWEKVWQTTINDDVIKFFYNFSAGVAEGIDRVGGLIPVVTTVIGLFLVWKNLAIGVNIATKALSLSFDTMLGPIGLVIAAISTILMILNAVGDATDQLERANQKLSESQSKLQSLEDKKNNIKSLSEEYNALAKNTKKSTDKYQRFVEVQNELKSLLPGIAGYYDQSGNFVLDSDAIATNQAYLDILQQQIDAERVLASIQAEKAIKAAQKSYEASARKVAVGTTEQLPQTMGSEGFYIPTITDEEVAQAQSDMASAVISAYESYVQLDEIAKSIFRSSLKEMGDFGASVLKLIGDNAQKAGKGIGGITDGISEIEDLISKSETLASSMDAVAKATSEQTKEGKISYSTALDLISANANLAQYLTKTADGYIFDAEAAKASTYATMQDTFAKYAAKYASVDLANAAIAAANGNYIFARSAIETSKATDEEKKSMLGLLQAFAAMNVSVAVPSSGGGSAISAQKELNDIKKKSYEDEIKNIKKQKDVVEDQIKALEALKDAYNDIIDAKKESLRLAKEEADFQNDIEDKNEELADIENKLFAIQRDNSQEATAQRLKLEEEKAKKIEEIAEMQADRTYDLEIDALDAEAEAYEKMIDKQIAGLDKVISKFDIMIERITEMIALLSEMASAAGGGASGYSAVSPTKSKSLSAAEKASIIAANKAARTPSGTSSSGGGTPSIVERFSSGGSGKIASGYPNDSALLPVESGEMFAVLNRQQQDQIASNPIASLFSTIMGVRGMSPQVSNADFGNGETVINIGDIIVQGNLDKVSLKDVESSFLKTANMAISQRGKKTNVFNKSI